MKLFSLEWRSLGKVFKIFSQQAERRLFAIAPLVIRNGGHNL